MVVTLKIKRNSQKRKSTSCVMELKEVAKTEFSWTVKRDLWGAIVNSTRIRDILKAFPSELFAGVPLKGVRQGKCKSCIGSGKSFQQFSYYIFFYRKQIIKVIEWPQSVLTYSLYKNYYFSQYLVWEVISFITNRTVKCLRKHWLTAIK